MPTSVYFNNQGASREQLLLEDMVIESIKNHGIDVIYLPRGSQSTPKVYSASNPDELFGDDPIKAFTKAYPLDVYLETYNNFEGNEEFFSKFGLEVNKGVKVTLARRTFEKFVPSTLRNVPKEGDLIWLPTQLKLMEIKFVEQEKSFFQLGRPGGGAVSAVAGAKIGYMYELSLETFKYNGEVISTGYPEIDAIADMRAFSVSYTLNAGGTSTFDQDELVYQGASYATATATGYVADWNKPTRILQLRNVRGEFAANAAIKGTASGASWVLSAAPDTMEDASTPFDDNVRIENEADNILDFTETNPFGEP